MATTANDGAGWTNVSGTAFTSTASCYDGSSSTYGALTTATTGDHVGDVTGYDFGGIIQDTDTLVSVVVNVQQYVTSAVRWNNPTVQAYDGVTAIGSPATLTERTSPVPVASGSTQRTRSPRSITRS